MTVLRRCLLSLAVLSLSIHWARAITGTFCGTGDEFIVRDCCHLNNYTNSTYVKTKYTTHRNLGSGERPWTLDVNITWRNNPQNRSVRYAVSFVPTNSPEDIEDGQVPTDLVKGHCTSAAFHPFKYSDFPPSSCTVPDQWDIVDEPQYAKEDLLFGFTYRLLIREYDGTDASAYTTCLTGYHDPAFNTPDCMLETGDVYFCMNEPIVVSGAVTNLTVEDPLEIVSDLDVPTLTVIVYWEPPIQINGNITFYVVQLINEGTQVYFSREYPNENDTEGITRELIEIPLSRDQYELQVTPFVIVNPETFSTDIGTQIRDNYAGHERSLLFSYVPPTVPPPATATEESRPLRDSPPPSPEGGLSPLLVMAASVSGAMSILALLFVIYMYRLHQKRREIEEQKKRFKPHVPEHPRYKTDAEILAMVDPEFRGVEILDEAHIMKELRLGSGQYGVVYKGKALLRDKTKLEEVAIKEPIRGSNPEQFKNEIRMMLDLGKHSKIIAVRGCCTREEPYCMITDFMEYGDLLHFLRKCDSSDNWTLDPIYQLSALNQIQIAAQIADGMTYVSTTRYFHGDLAARNILVGKELLIKISDFGFTDDLYETGKVKLKQMEKRPYKWYGPETYRTGFCTAKTDIWSFGVVLWEIYTFGKKSPYQGCSMRDIEHKLVVEGYRLPAPERCHPKMHQMMLQCWDENPEARPSFDEIFEALTVILEKIGDEYCELDENEEYQRMKAKRERKPSLVETLNLMDEDYTSWSNVTSDTSVFSSESLGSDAVFTPIFEEPAEEAEA